MTEWFDARTDAVLWLSHPFGDGAYLAILLCQERHYAIGLTESDRSQCNALVAEVRHR